MPFQQPAQVTDAGGPAGRPIVAANLLLTLLPIGCIMEELAHRRETAGQVAGIMALDEVRADFRDRRVVGSDAALAARQAFRHRQTPTLVKAGIKREQAMAIQPVQLMIGHLGQKHDVLARQRIVTDQIAQLGRQEAGCADDNQLGHPGALRLGQPAPGVI